MVVHHSGHFRARTEFAGLTLCGKNGYLRVGQVIQNELRHVRERPARVMFEHKQTVF